MYQLSHLITEQKSLLTSLLEISISGMLLNYLDSRFLFIKCIFLIQGERGPGSSAQEIIEISAEEVKEKKEKENRKKLTALMEKIEGCSVSIILIHYVYIHNIYLYVSGCYLINLYKYNL